MKRSEVAQAKVWSFNRSRLRRSFASECPQGIQIPSASSGRVARSAVRWGGAKRRPLKRREAPSAEAARSAVRRAVSERAAATRSTKTPEATMHGIEKPEATKPLWVDGESANAVMSATKMLQNASQNRPGDDFFRKKPSRKHGIYCV